MSDNKSHDEAVNNFIVAMVKTREAIDIGYCNKWLKYANADPVKVVSAQEKLDDFEIQHYGAVKALQRMVKEYVEQIDCSIGPDQELTDAFELPTDEWYAKPVTYMVKNHTTTSKGEIDEVIAFEKNIVEAEAGVIHRGIGSAGSIT